MSLLDEHAQERDAAVEHASALATDLAEFCPSAAQALGRAAARVRNGRFRVLLLGSFSTGKSTLLNAMLGCRVMPAKVNPCTAVRTEVVWGETPRVDIQHTDGTEVALEPEAFAEAWQLENSDAHAAGTEWRDRFSNIDHARVAWPLPLLRNGVILTDTSGLDDDPTRTARTLHSLPDADAVIVVLSAVRFMTHLERQTLRRDLLPLGLKNLFFVVTMVDLLDALTPEPERERERLEQRAREVLGPLCRAGDVDRFDQRVFWVDARKALGARASHRTGRPRKRPHRRVLQESGLPGFEQALETFLIHERGQAQLHHLHAVQGRARRALQEQHVLNQRTHMATVADLQDRHTALQPRLDALKGMADSVGRTVDDFIARQQGLIWQDLRAQLAQAEADFPAELDALDLGPLAQLETWTPEGRTRLEALLTAHLETWLNTRIEAWQATLLPRVVRALDRLRDELAVEAAQFESLAHGIVADFVGESIAVPSTTGTDTPVDPVERWFSVAVGALLLSPGTVAAAWTDGYEGALKGAASRIGVRLAVVSLGALVGPMGGAAVALYALSDAALFGWTTEGRMKRLRREIATGLQGQLVAQADAAKAPIYEQIRSSLTPLRDAIVQAVQQEAEAVDTQLSQIVGERARAKEDAEQLERRITGLLDRFPPASE